MPDNFRQKLAGTSIGTTTKVGTYTPPKKVYTAPTPKQKEKKRDKRFRQELSKTPAGRELIKSQAKKEEPKTEKITSYGAPKTPPKPTYEKGKDILAPTPMEQALMKQSPKMGQAVYEARTTALYGAPTSAKVSYIREQVQEQIPPSYYKQQFGYVPYDPDYNKAIGEQQDVYEQTFEELEAEKKFLKEYDRTYNELQKNIRTVRDAPEGSVFEVDFDESGSIDDDERITRQEALDYLTGKEQELVSQREQVVENIPKLSRQLTGLTYSIERLEEYKREGYTLETTDDDKYQVGTPKASEVVEAIYGDRPDLYVAQSMRSLGIGTLASGTAQLITGDEKFGEAEKETLATGILGATKRKGESLLEHAGRVWTSPEVIMDIYLPAITLGAGYGIKAVSLAGKTATGLTGSALRLTGLAGKTALYTVGGTGVVTLGVGMGIKAYQDPYSVPGEIGRTAYRFGMAYAGYKYGEGLAESRFFASDMPPSETLAGRKGTMRSPYDVSVESPRMEIIREVKPSELGIRVKSYFGKTAPDVKAYQFKGGGKLPGGGRSNISGYLVTTDKTVVLEVYGKHPALKYGSEIYLIGERQFVFGTGTTTMPYKTGILNTTKGEYTSVADYFGFSQTGDKITTFFKPSKVEPGITTELFVSKLTTIPRSGGRLTTTGFGEAKSLYTGRTYEVETVIQPKQVYSSPPGWEDIMVLGEKQPVTMGETIVKAVETGYIKTKFIGETTPRTAPYYSRNIILEKGTIFGDKSLMGGGQPPTTGGGVDVVTPTRSGTFTLYGDTTQVEGVTISMMKAVAGTTTALRSVPKSVPISTPPDTSAVVSGTGAVTETKGEPVEKTVVTTVGGLNRGQQEYYQETSQDFWTDTKKVVVTSPKLETGYGTIFEEERETEVFRGGRGRGERGEPITEQIESVEPITEFGKSMDTKQDQLMKQESITGLQMKQIALVKPITVTTPQKPIIKTGGGKLRIRPPVPREKKREPVKTSKRFVKPRRQEDLISRPTKRKRKGLLADILSVTQSQARYGTATQPRLTKKLWEEAEKKLFMRVPTKELLGDDKKKEKKYFGKKKGGKKNAYY